MGTALPSSVTAPAVHGDALHHFLERRRQRFISTFAAQCDEILTLISEVEQRGSRGPIRQLRKLTYRLGTLARIAGFGTVGDCVIELERVVSSAAAGLFDEVLAREMVHGLHEALATDMASFSHTASARPAVTEYASPATPRILIVDDHAMLRAGLRALLASGFAGASFAEAHDGAEALAQLRQSDFDLALLDVSLPGRNGLDLLKELKAEWPRLAVLVLSGHREDEVAMRALKAGASGYLTKESAPDELVRAVRKILNGGRYVSESLAEQLAGEAGNDLERRAHEALSDREYDVMCRIASGRTVSEIAKAMSLSVKTISTYRTRVLQKLRLRNNAEIVQYAVKNQLVC